MSLEPYTEVSTLVVQVDTDAGHSGWAQINGRPLETIAELVTEYFGPPLWGQDPERVGALYRRQRERMDGKADVKKVAGEGGQPHFGMGLRPQMMAALGGLDMAFWDLKAKQANRPLYQFLGGDRDTVEVYATGGYYRAHQTVEHLIREVGGYRDQGFHAVKIKFGGLPIGEDMKRVEAICRRFPDLRLMVDANSAWSVPEALDAIRQLNQWPIAWLEEPLQWYDAKRGLTLLARASTLPLASGESEINLFGCRDLIDLGVLEFMQFDATRAGGVTEWLRVAAYALAHGVLMAPHHDPHIHGHLVAAVDNGYIVETMPDPERDPLTDQLFLTDSHRDGHLYHLSNEPGLGIRMNPAVLDRFLVKTYRMS